MNDVHDFNVCSCEPVYHYVMSVCQNRPPRRAQPAYSEITIALWCSICAHTAKWGADALRRRENAGHLSELLAVDDHRYVINTFIFPTSLQKSQADPQLGHTMPSEM